MDHFDLLINALRIIASPYKVQKEYYPDFVNLSDEIAGELECLEFIETAKFPAEILDKISEIDEQFLFASFGEKNYFDELWTDWAVEHEAFWQKQRERARGVLTELGVGYAVPRKFC